MKDRPFELLAPDDRRPERREVLADRALPPTLGSHREAARSFSRTPIWWTPSTWPLAVDAPLLLTGEPGTGKTQVAFYLAWYFSIEDTIDSHTMSLIR